MVVVMHTLNPNRFSWQDSRIEDFSMYPDDACHFPKRELVQDWAVARRPQHQSYQMRKLSYIYYIHIF